MWRYFIFNELINFLFIPASFACFRPFLNTMATIAENENIYG